MKKSNKLLNNSLAILLRLFQIVFGFGIVLLGYMVFLEMKNDSNLFHMVVTIILGTIIAVCGVVIILIAIMPSPFLRKKLCQIQSKQGAYTFYDSNLQGLASEGQDVFYIESPTGGYVTEAGKRFTLDKSEYLLNWEKVELVQFMTYCVILVQGIEGKPGVALLINSKHQCEAVYNLITHRELVNELDNELYLVRSFVDDQGKTRYQCFKFLDIGHASLVSNSIHPISLDYVQYEEMLVSNRIALLPKHLPEERGYVYEPIGMHEFMFIFTRPELPDVCYVTFNDDEKSYIMEVDKRRSINEVVKEVFRTTEFYIPDKSFQLFLEEDYVVLKNRNAEGEKVKLYQLPEPGKG